MADIIRFGDSSSPSKKKNIGNFLDVMMENIIASKTFYSTICEQTEALLKKAHLGRLHLDETPELHDLLFQSEHNDILDEVYVIYKGTAYNGDDDATEYVIVYSADDYDPKNFILNLYSSSKEGVERFSEGKWIPDEEGDAFFYDIDDSDDDDDYDYDDDDEDYFSDFDDEEFDPHRPLEMKLEEASEYIAIQPGSDAIIRNHKKLMDAARPLDYLIGFRFMEDGSAVLIPESDRHHGIAIGCENGLFKLYVLLDSIDFRGDDGRYLLPEYYEHDSTLFFPVATLSSEREVRRIIRDHFDRNSEWVDIFTIPLTAKLVVHLDDFFMNDPRKLRSIAGNMSEKNVWEDTVAKILDFANAALRSKG